MSVADSALGLNTAQREMARVIERELAARGLPAEIIAAAIVNAKAESGLNPTAAGDGGKSVGLFQLHVNGAGKGMSVEERKDPVKNTARIAQEYASKWGAPLRAAYAAGTRDVGEFAALWSKNIERPSDTLGAMAYRRALALRTFPTVGKVAKTFAVGWFAAGGIALILIGIARRRK
jgi:tail lysozyme